MFHNRVIKIGKYWGNVNAVFVFLQFYLFKETHSIHLCVCVLPPHLAGIYNLQRLPGCCCFFLFVCLFERIIHFAVAFGTAHFSFGGNILYNVGEKCNADWVHLKRQTTYKPECWISTASFAQICTDITAKPHSWSCENTASVLRIWRRKNSFICSLFSVSTTFEGNSCWLCLAHKPTQTWLRTE